LKQKRNNLQIKMNLKSSIRFIV